MVKSRREREREAMRVKILDAARALFVKSGYEAVTLRRIATAIEYAPMSIYNYFPNKQSLIETLLEEDFRAFAEVFTRASDVTDPIERIKKAGEAYLQFAATCPNHYQMVFLTRLPEGGDCTVPKENSPAEASYTFLRDAVAQAIAAGCFRPELSDPDGVTQTLWAGVHGVASLYILTCSDHASIRWAGFEQASGAMLDALMYGLLREPRPQGGVPPLETAEVGGCAKPIAVRKHRRPEKKGAAP